MIRGVVAVVLMVMTSSAWAFECTKTDDGLESIRWPSSPVAVAMLAPGPATTSASVASAAFEGAVAAWNAPACSSIELRLQGVISLPSDAEGQGHIAFISNNWPHSPDALSIPTMTFHLETGAIRNGKVEINEANFRFANADATCPMGDEYDLQSALTPDDGHRGPRRAHDEPEAARVRFELSHPRGGRRRWPVFHLPRERRAPELREPGRRRM